MSDIVMEVPVKRKRGRPRKVPVNIESVECNIGIGEIMKICKKNKIGIDEENDVLNQDVEEYEENVLEQMGHDIDEMPNCPHPRPQKAGRRGRKKKNIEIPIEELNESVALLKDRTSIALHAEDEGEPMNLIMGIEHSLLGSDVVPVAQIDSIDSSSNTIVPYKQIFHQEDVVEAIFSEVNVVPRLLDSLINRRCPTIDYKQLLVALKDKTDNFGDLWENMFVKHNIETTDAITDKLNDVIQFNEQFIEAITKYINVIDKSHIEQSKLADKLDEHEETIKNAEPIFDESCIWGLKPIRRAFAPPFFKSVDGLVSAPGPGPFWKLDETNEEIALNESVDPDCIFKRDKQKWTLKDFKILRGIVMQCLQEQLRISLKNRLNLIMFDCEQDLKKREEELRASGPPEGLLKKKKRGRGRPRKTKMTLAEQESLFGVAHPFLYELEGGIRVTYSVTPPKLEEWRDAGLKAIKTMTLIALLNQAKQHRITIDWGYISKQMTEKTRKIRSNEDCLLIYEHQLIENTHPQRWLSEDFTKLKGLVNNKHNDWDIIEQKVGRNSYECFFRYRNKIETGHKKVKWNKETDQALLKAVRETEGNWVKVTDAVSKLDKSATKKQIQERWKKKVNPVLKQGAFSRVEDALLFLTMEKLKPQLNHEGHFGSIMPYLPWRFETTWRDRATQLFADWIVPWTKKEDELLLEYEKKYNRNWSLISQKFSSFKTRKGCLTRFRILEKQLRQFNNVEDYHQQYSKTRFNVIQFTHLNEILHLLKNIYPVKFEWKFIGISANRSPSNERLQYLLMGFDRNVMKHAIESIEGYIEARNVYWADWNKDQAEKKRKESSKNPGDNRKGSGKGRKRKFTEEKEVVKNGAKRMKVTVEEAKWKTVDEERDTVKIEEKKRPKNMKFTGGKNDEVKKPTSNGRGTGKGRKRKFTGEKEDAKKGAKKMKTADKEKDPVKIDEEQKPKNIRSTRGKNVEVKKSTSNEKGTGKGKKKPITGEEKEEVKKGPLKIKVTVKEAKRKTAIEKKDQAKKDEKKSPKNTKSTGGKNEKVKKPSPKGKGTGKGRKSTGEEKEDPKKGVKKMKTEVIKPSPKGKGTGKGRKSTGDEKEDAKKGAKKMKTEVIKPFPKGKGRKSTGDEKEDPKKGAKRKKAAVKKPTSRAKRTGIGRKIKFTEEKEDTKKGAKKMKIEVEKPSPKGK